MSTVFFPEATPVLGNLSVRAILSATDLSAISLTTEWNASTSLDLSCFLRPFSPNAQEQTGSRPDRICTTITLPQRGRTQISAFELHYVYDPQADDTDPNNKAKSLLVEGTELIIVQRKGVALGTAGATGQKYEAWKGTLGRQNHLTSGTDDMAEFEIVQNFLPSQDVVYGAIA